MAAGLVQYLFGQKYLKSVGNFLGASENKDEKDAMNKPLSKIEKDRVVVLLISFLLVIIFWGAFEQAGGLMNLYASDKTDRILSFSLPFIGNEVPASVVSIFKCYVYYIFRNYRCRLLGKQKIKRQNFYVII